MNQFPKGYQACGFHCGIKKAKDDLTVVVSDVQPQQLFIRTIFSRQHRWW